jgi:hypothetical protein
MKLGHLEKSFGPVKMQGPGRLTRQHIGHKIRKSSVRTKPIIMDLKKSSPRFIERGLDGIRPTPSPGGQRRPPPGSS